MKFTSINLGETRIDFYNSFFGRESIFVNGEEVSSKKSLTGTEHIFTVTESGELVEYRLVTGLNFNGVAISLYRNGLPLIESPTGRLWQMILLVLIIMCFGYLLGKGWI